MYRFKNFLVASILFTTLSAVPTFAQGIITTVAGNGERGIWGNGGQAIHTPLDLGPYTGGVAVDAAGNLYIADTGSHRIYKVSSNGRRLTVAGSDCWVCTVDEQQAGDPQAGFSGDGGQAFSALLNSPSGLGIDAAGSLYIVDAGNQRIRKVSPDGVITTVAGDGRRGFSGDGGPAINASLNLTSRWWPAMYSGNVAVDAEGNLYIADTGNGRIRKVTTDGIITSVAYFGDDLFSVAVDLSGNIYTARNIPHVGGAVQKITPGGTLTTVTGFRVEPVRGPSAPFGDGGSAADAWLLFPRGVAVDAAGNLYIADSGAHRIRRVEPGGRITTVGGYGGPVFLPPDPISGEGGRYIVEGGFSGDGGLSSNAQLNTPGGVAADAVGNIHVADSLNNRIRKVKAENSGPTQSTFTSPTGIFMSFSSDEVSPASPYPSAIAVSGLLGSVTKVTVTLTNLDLGSPADFDILLVAPSGQGMVLMSDAQGDWTSHIIKMTLIFDDAAPSPLPSDRTLTPGTYKPTNFDSDADFFLAPAPVGPYGTTLSVFNGTNPNGTWSLYVVRDHPGHFLDEGPPDPVIISSWSLTVTASAQSPPVNPIEDAQFFVTQHYLEFLNREPDAGGLAYWTDRIAQCGSNATCIRDRRNGVSAAFFIELEFQDTGYYVYRFYKASLGRQPNYAEFNADRSKVVDGPSLEANKQAFADEWVQRLVFLQAYPNTLSNSEFVNKLFDTAGLTASIYDPQRQQEIAAMNSGRSRALVLRDVIEIPDFKNTPDPNSSRYAEVKQVSQYNPAFVLMQYFGYLRRNIDQNGYDFWLDVLNNRAPNNYHAMVCAFLTSAEYQLRFGTSVTRTNQDCGP